jgi:hypothetical protein
MSRGPTLPALLACAVHIVEENKKTGKYTTKNPKVRVRRYDLRLAG